MDGFSYTDITSTDEEKYHKQLKNILNTKGSTIFWKLKSSKTTNKQILSNSKTTVKDNAARKLVIGGAITTVSVVIQSSPQLKRASNSNKK